MKGIIYCATNKISGKKYIGQTKYCLESRKKEHIKTAKKNKGFYFHKALLKYDFNFDWIVIEDNIELDDLDKKEEEYIKFYNTFNSIYGYNLTSGGDFGKKVKYSNEELDFVILKRKELNSEKELLIQFNEKFNRNLVNVYSIRCIIKTYISEEENSKINFLIKSKNSKNRVETEISKINRSNSQKGKKWSEETKIKQSKNRLGFKHSEETKNKVRENNKRTIKFTDNEINFIIKSLKDKISKRRILIMLNDNFGYSINITSTSIIDRILKENNKINDV